MSDEYKAIYWRYHVQREEECDSAFEANQYLEWGEQSGELPAVGVMGPDGKMISKGSYCDEDWIEKFPEHPEPPTPPRQWSLPPEPGPEVKAVRGDSETIWTRGPNTLFGKSTWWRDGDVMSEICRWPELFDYYPTLTDCTHELEE